MRIECLLAYLAFSADRSRGDVLFELNRIVLDFLGVLSCLPFVSGALPPVASGSFFSNPAYLYMESSFYSFMTTSGSVFHLKASWRNFSISSSLPLPSSSSSFNFFYSLFCYLTSSSSLLNCSSSPIIPVLLLPKSRPRPPGFVPAAISSGESAVPPLAPLNLDVLREATRRELGFLIFEDPFGEFTSYSSESSRNLSLMS